MNRAPAAPARPADRDTAAARAARPSVLVRRLAGVLGTVVSGAVRRIPAEDVVASLGPAAIKVAQLLATRPDLVGERWSRRLGTLCDRVPPMSAVELDRALRAAYGPDPEARFHRFERVPAASGSIADVHRAETASGGTVALKVIRPGTRDRLETDFALARLGVRLYVRWVRPSSRPMVDMVADLGRTVIAQADLVAERANLERLRENISRPGIRVPGTHPEHSNDHVLAMEFVEPLVPLADRPSTVDGERAGTLLLEAVYRMLFADGLVHCDLHRGNVYARADTGELVLLDAGFMFQLPPSIRLRFSEFFLQMALGHGERCGTLVLASAIGVRPGCDERAFVADVAGIVRAVYRRTVAEFSLVDFARALFGAQYRHGIYVDPRFVYPLVSLATVEGMLRDLAPDVNFQAVALPYLFAVLNDAGPRGRYFA